MKNNKGNKWMIIAIFALGLIGFIVAECQAQQNLDALVTLDSTKAIQLVSTEGDTTYNVAEYYSVPGLNIPKVELWFDEYVTKDEMLDALRVDYVNTYIQLSNRVRQASLLNMEAADAGQVSDVYDEFGDTTLLVTNRDDYTSQFSGFYVVTIDTSAFDSSLSEWDSLDINNERAVLRVYVDESGLGRPISNWGEAINRDSAVVYDPSTEFGRIRIFGDYTPNNVPNTNTMVRVAIIGRTTIPGGFTSLAADARVAFTRTRVQEIEGVFRPRYEFSNIDRTIILTKLK